MTFNTWNAIAQQHMRYRALLMQRMAALDEKWPEGLDSIRYGFELAERAMRHQARMERHMAAYMHHLPAGGPAH